MSTLKQERQLAQGCMFVPLLVSENIVDNERAHAAEINDEKSISAVSGRWKLFRHCMC